MLLGKESYYWKINIGDYVKNENRVPVGEVVYLLPDPIII
jgi:hypothetical protein